MIVGSGRATEGGRVINVTFCGEPLDAREGDTLASALMAAGRLELGADPVTGRPRGVRWLDRTSEILLAVSGRRRAFDPGRLVLRDGMRITHAEAQAGLPPAGGGVDTDVLVVGAGPAGLIAAETALGGGARVLLVDRASGPGGSLAWSDETIGRQKAADWCAAQLQRLKASGAEVMFEAELLPAETDSWRVWRRDMGTVWTLRAEQTVLATGAVSRMPAFTGNDLPGVMTAATMRQMQETWGVLPGQRIAVLASGDEGRKTAEVLRGSGVEIIALVDTRASAGPEDGWPVYPRSHVRAAEGDGRLQSIEIEGPGGRRQIACDGLAVATGWSPQISPLLGRVRPIWNPAIAAWLVPPGSPPGVHPAGAAGGTYTTKGAMKAGFFRARKALTALGRPIPPIRLPQADDAETVYDQHWFAPGPGPSFVDFTQGLTLEALTAEARDEDHGAIAGRYVADSRLA